MKTLLPFNKVFLLLCLSILLVYSCTEHNTNNQNTNHPTSNTEEIEKKIEEQVDSGVIINNVYSNQYYEFSIRLDSTWELHDADFIKRRLTNSKKLIQFESHYQKMKYEEQIKQVLPLVYMTKGEKSKAFDFEASISINSENLVYFRKMGISNPKRYLEQIKKNLYQTKLAISTKDDIQKLRINPYYLRTLKSKITAADEIQYQKYYVVFIKKHILSIVASYKTEKQEKEISRMISSLTFSSPHPKTPGL